MLHLNLFFLMKDQQLKVESRICTQVLSVDSVITSLSLVRLPLTEDQLVKEVITLGFKQ